MPHIIDTPRIPCPRCAEQGRSPATGVWRWAIADDGENTDPTCTVCGFYAGFSEPTPIPPTPN
ncbi:hypothetical protein SAMN04487905_111156 [Actinopolyspora xinjiangensis]|uniref:Uncharacterized protein n=1 Tax=Actinopolyspora xinjiangensis TaxID=405564 RepID=A0A1H0WBB5_9ACTN|nr:hypothetical protein [Actinopolyspora xinjiangensis]SDP87994.1 hypothetical protein SAMN04487905_111156 [Actinopolyspora xinjiangensis]